MNPRNLPNIISVFRILLVPPVVWYLLHGRYDIALGLFLLAGFSDGLDGYLARHYQWTSRLGAILDPLADKLLMFASYLTLGWLHDLPVWLVAVVILRDVVIIGGSLMYRWLIGRVEFKPMWISKLNTVCQILLVTLTLLILAGLDILQQVQTGLIYLVLVTTISSGIAYVYVWSRRAMNPAGSAPV
ncbi:MAG: CDP-alcohol phosphatidyltransferase family protein [Proteobacteria bacterium]|nr:CDP-alcohol phosphatidyltransferase family protein [Pseudomonadota bacterium]